MITPYLNSKDGLVVCHPEKYETIGHVSLRMGTVQGILQRAEARAYVEYLRQSKTFLLTGIRDGLRVETPMVTESSSSSSELRPTRKDGKAVYRAKEDRETSHIGVSGRCVEMPLMNLRR